jgi:hypothetical protein
MLQFCEVRLAVDSKLQVARIQAFIRAQLFNVVYLRKSHQTLRGSKPSKDWFKRFKEMTLHPYF